MALKSLNLQNYRTYRKVVVDIAPVTVLIGRNAQGKTNFLEAISYLSFGKSFRSQDKDLIRWGEEYFRIEARTDSGRKIEVFFGQNPPKKLLKIDNQLKKQTELFGFNYAVLFSPEDINLVTASPELKRRFLDLVISQVDKSYLFDLINYRKALKQRNTLLSNIREGHGSLRELEIWDDKLVERGLRIIAKRYEFFNEIEDDLASAYGAFSKQRLWLKYESSVGNSEENFRTLLRKNQSLDIVSAKTAVGPHRDDFEFYLDQKPLEGVGSRGEFRSAVLALKQAEIKYIEKKTDQKPMFLLDDVFSELDENRREALYHLVGDYQTIITSTDLSHLSEELLSKGTVLNIDGGEIRHG